MTVESTEAFCPFCELHEYDIPMFDENMTPELRSAVMDLIKNHIKRLNELLDYDQYVKDYVPSLAAEVKGLEPIDDWAISISERAKIISALVDRILGDD